MHVQFCLSLNEPGSLCSRICLDGPEVAARPGAALPNSAAEPVLCRTAPYYKILTRSFWAKILLKQEKKKMGKKVDTRDERNQRYICPFNRLGFLYYQKSIRA